MEVVVIDGPNKGLRGTIVHYLEYQSTLVAIAVGSDGLFKTVRIENLAKKASKASTNIK